MVNKLSTSWKKLNTEITISKRELVLGTACSIMAGMLFGIFFSPKKQVAIGSNNGCNNTDSGNSSVERPGISHQKLCKKH